ncbi:MAG TPA: apolipoprotein N-acyltransferase [Spirochaetota bacterium]|nr:apolipoprotein N-acyltransferase [Spirochaetota bacterium]
MNTKVTILKILLYTALGILWSYSNVGYPLEYLSWITLAPFLFFIRKETLKGGIFYSLLFGTTFYLIHLLWMPKTFILFFAENGPTPGLYVVSALVTFLFALYHGFMYVLLYLGIRFAAGTITAPASYLMIPVVAAAVDYFYPKYWFDRMGYALNGFFPIIQTADLFGVPFLTFVVVLGNTAALTVFECLVYKRKPIFGLLTTSTAAIVIIASIAYGKWRIADIDTTARNAPHATVGVVQGNYSGMDKRDEQMLEVMLKTYNDLSIGLMGESPDLIVWPESADPHYYPIEKTDYTAMKKFPAPLIFGTHLTAEDKKENDTDAYNSVVFLSARGYKLDHYNKNRLMPFIEGFSNERLNDIMGWYDFESFTYGKKRKIFKTGSLKIAPNICFEDIIPSFVRKSTNINGEKANILINSTNNSWFGRSAEPLMHFRIAGFRAIENRKTFTRATCTGYSSIFDPTGRAIYSSGLFTKEAVAKSVPLMEIETVYSQYGWYFPYIMTGIAAIMISVNVLQTARKKRNAV